MRSAQKQIREECCLFGRHKLNECGIMMMMSSIPTSRGVGTIERKGHRVKMKLIVCGIAMSIVSLFLSGSDARIDSFAGIERGNVAASAPPPFVLTNANYTTFMAPVYEVDLDLSPELRWKEAFDGIFPKTHLTHGWLQKYILSLSKHLTPAKLQLVDNIVGTLIMKYQDVEEMKELQGVGGSGGGGGG